MLKLLLLTSVTWSAVSVFVVGTFGLSVYLRDQRAQRAALAWHRHRLTGRVRP